MVEYSNKYIVAGLRDGSQSLFCYLYDRYYSDLNRFAFHIVMCDDSHDIVNDIFVKLWEGHKKLSPDIELKPYLYAAVRNNAFNHLKHRKVIDSRREKIVEAMLFIHENWDGDHDYLIDVMNDRIGQLPEQQKKIVTMKYNGMSHGEIAEELNISVKTVNNHIFSAYKFIRKNILIFIFTC